MTRQLPALRTEWRLALRAAACAWAAARPGGLVGLAAGSSAPSTPPPAATPASAHWDLREGHTLPAPSTGHGGEQPGSWLTVPLHPGLPRTPRPRHNLGLKLGSRARAPCQLVRWVRTGTFQRCRALSTWVAPDHEGAVALARVSTGIAQSPPHQQARSDWQVAAGREQREREVRDAHRWAAVPTPFTRGPPALRALSAGCAPSSANNHHCRRSRPTAPAARKMRIPSRACCSLRTDQIPGPGEGGQKQSSSHSVCGNESQSEQATGVSLDLHTSL